MSAQVSDARDMIQRPWRHGRPGGEGDGPDILIILATFLGLSWGAVWLVEGAAHLAKRLGMSELVIGLSVVALGCGSWKPHPGLEPLSPAFLRPFYGHLRLTLLAPKLRS